MYDHREMKYEQKIKDNFNVVFLCKKETLHLQETEKTIFINYLRRRQIFFVAMRYRASALFFLFLHGKEWGMWKQKREETWFKDLLEGFCDGKWKKDFRMSGESFHELVALLAPRISKNGTSCRKVSKSTLQ